VKIITLISFFLFCIELFAQKKNDAYQLHIDKATSAIRIDGVMDEQAWINANIAKDFFMVFPMDTSDAKVTTEVRMTYDANNLYIIAICNLLTPGNYMVESLRRDFNFGRNDNFIFFIDPFDDQTNGFTFGANAAGAQWDGMLYSGGSADLNWDNKWVSAVKNYPDKWIFEASIPFKSIRYKKGIAKWGINFSRLDIKVAEKSAWAPVPRQFPTASLAYTGNLIWDQPPPDPGTNVSIIPYALAGLAKDFNNNTKVDYKKNIGADAKIALTSSINLDLTVNPDFSQVEVDKQVTNLDRFELFFPERRQFFLENNDLFANFGYAGIRPFFSRRVGLGVPINYGARLSGSLNKNWRVGAMDIQTGNQTESGLPAQNFTVLALQRRVFSRSNIRMLFVNKQSINYDHKKDSTKPLYSQYNRNLGLEYNLASSNNKWTGKVILVKSFSAGKATSDFVHAANLQYLNKKWNISWQHEYVGRNYNAEAGYVPRQNYIKLTPSLSHLFFPKHGAVLSHGPKVFSTYYFNEAWHHTDDISVLAYNVNLRNQSNFDVWVAHDYVQLLRPFDPTNFTKDTLPRGSKHQWNSFGSHYTSKPQQLFTYEFSTRFGGYYLNGSRFNLTGDVGYRFQPYVSIALSTSYNHIRLLKPWGNTNFWLIGPRIDVTMTNTLFFTTFIQYNNQLQNINLNTRLQWRYKPASDLFLVYTDNYYPSPLFVRNRAFVLKFTYWWSL
jgi:hypothetical protein